MVQVAKAVYIERESDIDELLKECPGHWLKDALVEVSKPKDYVGKVVELIKNDTLVTDEINDEDCFSQPCVVPFYETSIDPHKGVLHEVETTAFSNDLTRTIYIPVDDIT